MDYLAYIIVLVLVFANSVAAYIINRKRLKLDLTSEAGQKKDKIFRLILIILAVDTVIISAILLIVIKPMLGTPI